MFVKLIKNIFLTLLLFSHCFTAVGQNVGGPQNLKTFDQEPYHFGFFLAYNSASFLVDLKSSYSDSLLSMEVNPQPGFDLGIVSSLNITPEIRLRFTPSLSFQDRVFEYRFLRADTTVEFLSKRVESTFIDFPVNLKLRTTRVGNFAGYLIGGAKYSIDMASQEKALGNIVRISRNDYAAQVGGGMDFFLPYFKFGVEVKYSFGLKNIHAIGEGVNEFTSPIDRVRSSLWLLSFTFEG